MMAGPDSSHRYTLSVPMNVEQIVKKAQSFDYNPLIPLKYWLRTASTLLKEAEIYEHEGNDQQTYLLLFRHAQLVLRNLLNHPDARLSKNRSALAIANKEVENNLAKLEVLQPRLNKRYELYQQLLLDHDAKETLGSETGIISNRNRNDSDRNMIDTISSEDFAVGSGSEALAAEENRELAVRIAHKEMKRRATARRETRQAGISEEEEQERGSAGFWGNQDNVLTKSEKGTGRDIISEQMQKIHQRVNGKQSDEYGNGGSIEEQRSMYHYPLIPEKRTRHGWFSEIPSSVSLQNKNPREILASTIPPQLPPKDPQTNVNEDLQSTKYQQPDPSKRRNSTRSATTFLQSGLKTSVFTFKPSARSENGTLLRTIFLPPDLRERFLSLALPNTRSNLETCGVLCGTLISNAFFISKLIVPDQESTSDTCETVNEDKLFDFVDGEDLLVLGWIHTHPTQTCFMSSRDLHTHSGYQAMMPESIAIVCAPSKGDWGVFRLTDPPGMKAVLNCTKEGLFHPHAETNIYTDALRPGHVYEAKGLEYDVVDLRPVQ